MKLSPTIKWISGVCAVIIPIATVWWGVVSYADDYLYTQAEADIHLTQTANRVCIEDSAKLVILEAQYPRGSVIPPHVATMMATLRDSVNRNCVKRI